VLSIVTGSIGLAVACLIVLLIRKDRLHVRHGLTWILVAACFAILGVFPGIIDNLAQLTGVSYPPILGITVAIAAIVIKILLMDLERSKIETRNQRLIQRVAMLESDMRVLAQAAHEQISSAHNSEVASSTAQPSSNNPPLQNSNTPSGP
jgi:hypothetical protein